MIDQMVASFPVGIDRYDAASKIRHEIARRTRRAVMSSHTLKVCPTCNTAKAHSDYNRCATRADGLDWQCRGCLAARRLTADAQGPS